MARVKLAALLALTAACGLLFLAWREDLRLPWVQPARFETERPGCVAGLTSGDYPALKLRSGFLSFYLAWGDKFPAAEIEAAGAHAAVLALTWEPHIKSEPGRSLLADIAAGKHDAYMREMAAAIRAYRRPVLLRWGHEPNGDWYSWTGMRNGMNPEPYILAWRRMARIIRKEAGPRARLLFSVNGEDKPAQAWNRFELYYPGAEYADAIALDIYNWGNARPWSSWRRPNLLLKTPYARALALAPGKPIFLTEVASCSSGGDKAVWLERLLDRLESRYTAVKGFMWFDFDKECDWRLSSDRKAAEEYAGRTGSGSYFSTDGGRLGWFFEGGKDGY